MQTIEELSKNDKYRWATNKRENGLTGEVVYLENYKSDTVCITENEQEHSHNMQFKSVRDLINLLNQEYQKTEGELLSPNITINIFLLLIKEMGCLEYAYFLANNNQEKLNQLKTLILYCDKNGKLYSEIFTKPDYDNKAFTQALQNGLYGLDIPKVLNIYE